MFFKKHSLPLILEFLGGIINIYCFCFLFFPSISFFPFCISLNNKRYLNLVFIQQQGDLILLSSCSIQFFFFFLLYPPSKHKIEMPIYFIVPFKNIWGTMNSCEWVLIQSDWVFLEEEEMRFGHRHTEEGRCEDTGRRQPPTSQEERPQKKPALGDNLILDF